MSDEIARWSDEGRPIIPVPPWQPIESAPRDGTPILLCHAEHKFISVGKWTGHGFGDEIFPIMNPTHWMALPGPPENTQ